MTTINENTYFILIDSKDGRKIVNYKTPALKLTKVEINPKFFLGKNLNSFWEYDAENKSFYEIKSSEFFKEDLCKKFLF